ncbi:DUF6907 domain-containing protein [Streptomyces sp. NRRL S-813]|uniref:DUF6907 domain-containing protein n=1 Tax=Streptomyces sp. NRRL S-813 TaxID=1463919 RepID=UPI0004C0F62A|nr:hypothetical protein [Streptomyces sp. NRRL S-813]
MTQHLPRTATVNVLVTRTVEIPEPDWCIGHRGDHAEFKPDVTHSGPETSATFETATRTFTYLHAWITQAPYGEIRPEPEPLLAVEIDGDTISMDPDTVRAFTATTRARLDALDALADEVERLRGEGR